MSKILQEHIAEYEIASAKIVDYDSRRATLLKKIDKLKDLYINDIITMDELKMDKEKYMKELKISHATRIRKIWLRSRNS